MEVGGSRGGEAGMRCEEAGREGWVREGREARTH